MGAPVGSGEPDPQDTDMDLGGGSEVTEVQKSPKSPSPKSTKRSTHCTDFDLAKTANERGPDWDLGGGRK